MPLLHVLAVKVKDRVCPNKAVRTFSALATLLDSTNAQLTLHTHTHTHTHEYT